LSDAEGRCPVRGEDATGGVRFFLAMGLYIIGC
jgi:hypothetical protein